MLIYWKQNRPFTYTINNLTFVSLHLYSNIAISIRKSHVYYLDEVDTLDDVDTDEDVDTELEVDTLEEVDTDDDVDTELEVDILKRNGK